MRNKWCSGLLLSALVAVLVSGCTSESETAKSATPNSSVGDSNTECGVVFEGELQNPIGLERGTFVELVDILSNNLVLVAEDGDPSKTTLVKLQGVGSAASATENQNSMNRINELFAGVGAYFFKATEDCNVSFQGRSGTIGHLLTPTGQSFNEDLVSLRFSPADKNDACEGSLLASCYAALEEGADEALAKVDACGFLWKPVSDSDGSAVVLFEECDVTLFVNGEQFRNSGSGNGRCSTMRGSKPGCAYGQAVLEAFEPFSGLPYVFPNGQTQLKLPGCQRVEYPCKR